MNKTDMNLYAQKALEYNLYLNEFYGLPATDADLTYSEELKAFEDENRVAFITGERPLSEYDKYVTDWLNMGGADILQAQIDQYNQAKGTDLQNGMK